MNCIKINPENGLVCAGSSAGRIEAWDPRYPPPPIMVYPPPPQNFTSIKIISTFQSLKIRQSNQENL